MRELDIIFREINQYAHAYRHLHEVERQYSVDNCPSIKMFFKRSVGDDPRRYNLPRVGEIAAVFVGENGEPPFERDIVVHPRGDELRHISILSGNCDPMVYPILFPYGEPGWRPGMDHLAEKRTAKRNYMNMLEFYAFRLSVRNEFSSILNAGKLFQQYAVDAYVKVEANNLNFIKLNQKQLRVEMYQGLMDFIHEHAEENQISPGKVIILPSSFPVIKFFLII